MSVLPKCPRCAELEAEVERLKAERDYFKSDRNIKAQALRAALSREKDANRRWSADVKKYRALFPAALEQEAPDE